MQEDKPDLKLNPKFDYQKSNPKFFHSKDAAVMTNYYPIELNRNIKDIYQYSIDFEPIIPADATKMADKIIDSAKKQFTNKIGYICFKGRMLWGTKSNEIPLIIKTQITVKDEQQIFEILIKPNIKITIEDFISKDQQNLTKLSQVLNINTKNVLRNIGFKQLDKGKFYDDTDFDTQKIQAAGLSIWRGYQVNVVSADQKLYLRADVCSRILRIDSFLQTMKSTKRMNDKEYINQTFKNQSVITRYGNHRILKIVQIDYIMTPKSTFTNYNTQKLQTFIEYYRTIYNCEIKEVNQPLIKIIVRNCLKDEIQYLVPELVSLTGLTSDQRSNFNVMKAVAQKTKLTVDQRISDTNKIISLINNEGKNDLMYSIKLKPERFPGYIIQSPVIQIGNKKQIYPEKGSFNLRGQIKDPIHLKSYYFVYVSRGDKDDQDADACISSLQEASKQFGIRLSKPIFIDIKANKSEKLTAKDWINQIKLENQQGKPEFIIFYFNMDQMKDKKLYQQLKGYIINELQIPSQVITKRTLSAGAKNGFSKASKILLQINDKMDHPLFTVKKQHHFWAKNSIAIGSLSVSRGPKGIIASFVGTRNNQMTKTYSDFLKIQKKQTLSKVIFKKFILCWLKQYSQEEVKKLPSTMILFRVGLNEKQAKKILSQQITEIQNIFRIVSQQENIPYWKPNLIYILVNQKDGTRVYLTGKGKVSNPLPGTIVGSQLSKDGSYEFLMSSASANQGTCNMVQYKVAYDSSNQQIPDEAVKMITNEQCYNYPNWNGSIRFPAILQKANKLAKFVSTNGLNKIDEDNPLKRTDYYI